MNGKDFTKNEVVAMMNRNTADQLRLIADHVAKHDYTSADIIAWLIELADAHEAQAVVVDLRDTLNPS